MKYSSKISIAVILAIIIIFLSPTLTYAKNTETIIDQEHFWFLDDATGAGLNDATGYGGAAIDGSIIDVPLSTQLRLRLGAVQTANKPDLTLTKTVKLQYSIDAGGTCSTGNWVDVPTNTAWTSQAFRQFDSSKFTDGTATTLRLDAVHALIGGDGVDLDGSPNSVSFTNGGLTGTEHAEWEWAIEEMLGTADQYWFRFINSDGSTTNVTWATCPSVTTVAAGSASTVTTNFANPGATTASLYGTKTGGEDATEHGFAYGTDSTLAAAATTSLGALASNSSFSSGVGGLTINTPYYFRAYATGDTGTGYGSILSFTTSNTTASRTVRLFEGFTIRFFNGRIIIHQR